MVIMKRAGRILKKNFFKYLAVMMIVILGMAVVIGYGNTSFSTKETTERYWERTNVEDGEFTTYVPLSNENKAEIENMGISLQETFYFDIDMGDDRTYRIFRSRKDINKEDIQEGSTSALSDSEVRMEQVYMSDNDVSVGDSITIDNKEYKVAACAVVPDYSHRVAEISDVGTDEKFALVFVSDNTYDELIKGRGSDEVYNYAYKVEKGNIKDVSNELYEFLIDVPVDEENIKDTYVLSKIQEINDTKADIADGFTDLKDGSKELSDGAQDMISAMDDSADQLKTAAASIPILEEGITGMQNSITDALDELSNGADELTDGIEEMEESVNDSLEEVLDWSYPNLYRFNEAESNTRIIDFVEGHKMYYSMAIVLGILIAVLIAYIMSVLASNIIDNEAKVIGTLYAMGYRKNELRMLYLLVPSIVVCIGSAAGTLLGFAITKYLVTANYSHPELIVSHPVSLLVYGIVMPIVLTIAINFFVINRKLDHTALEIMQNKGKEIHRNSDEENSTQKETGFIKAFRHSQAKKELKSHTILFFGISLSILIMMLGMGLYGSITHYADSIADDTNFENMYILTNPLEEQPADSETAFTKQYSMYCSMSGTDMPVVIQGVEKDSKYFDFADELTDEKNMIYASDSAVVKFGCKKGDKLIFTDKLNKKEHVFTVAGEVSYKNGIYFFMNIDSMRDYFDAEDDYYNTLLSDKKLDIDHNMLISATPKKTIVDTAESWVTDTIGTIGMFVIMSVIIFILVTWILVKNMLERSVYQISLLKIIGYRKNELNKVYLNSTIITVLLATIVTFPVGTLLMKSLIPMINASMKSGMKSYMLPVTYVIMAAIILVSYIAAYLMMQHKIAKIDANEVLKNRE